MRPVALTVVETRTVKAIRYGAVKLSAKQLIEVMSAKLCTLFNQIRCNKFLTCKSWHDGIQRRIQTRHPSTLKLDTPECRAIFTSEIKKLFNVFQKHNHELRIVGGSIRDLLLRRKIGDVDLASSATPEQMRTMFEVENIRTFNSRGEKHATVTVRIDDKDNFAITSLRKIIVTSDSESEQTKLEFTKDWYLDASCRDLTANAMFMGFDGTVFDYFNGIEDLENRRVRFVGNAADRIREDYFRILRYFRFYGLIARDPNSHDSDTLKIIKENISGLSGVPKSRIWTELKKILSGKFGPEILEQMLEVGIAPYIGLPENLNFNEFEKFRKQVADCPIHPVTTLASLLKNEADMLGFTKYMLISHFEEDLGNFIVTEREKMPLDPLKYYQEMMILTLGIHKELRQSIEQLLIYRGDVMLLKEFQNWEMPTFPVTGLQLVERGLLSTGRRLGFVKRALKKRWFDSSFTLTAEDLLDSFKEVSAEINEHFETLCKSEKTRKKRKKNFGL